MTKKKKVTAQKDWRTSDRVKLKATTKKFSIKQEREAHDYANQIGSYVGDAIDEHREFIGHYVPL